MGAAVACVYRKYDQGAQKVVAFPDHIGLAGVYFAKRRDIAVGAIRCDRVHVDLAEAVCKIGEFT